MAAVAYLSRIVVRPIGSKKPKSKPQFLLWNEMTDAPAGDRLYKSEEANNVKSAWPFLGQEQWWLHDKKEDAQAAADKLNRYLQARETALHKAKQSNKKKSHAQEF